jgi:protochlorophyllide reductase
MTSSVLITGASSGLGLAAASDLAASGCHVILACRSTARGQAAEATIRTRTPGASVRVLPLDLASLASVRSAASELIAGTPLDAVVCNAGLQVIHGVRRSEDGYELTFATNHLGHFLLIELLLDHIAEPGRIVVVSSGTHYGPLWSLGFPGPRWQHPRALADPAQQDDSAKAGRIRYSTSKLANLYATYELARRLARRKITVNAFDRD